MHSDSRSAFTRLHQRRIIGLVGMLGLCLSQATQAQSPPGTEIYLLSMTGDLQQTVPVNITERAGYDNQPAFSKDGSVIYFTRFLDMGAVGGQTDIFQYRLADQTTERITRTPFSEYSPTPMPDQPSLSVIRVEPPDNRQRLWALPLDRNQADLLIFEQIEPVGYHAWATPQTAAMFILGDAFTLALNQNDGSARTVASNIGRGIEVWNHADEQILFIDQSDADQSWIAALNVTTGQHRRVIRTLPDSEDFAIDQQGHLWMASGSRLYTAKIDVNDRWQQVADLSAHGLKSITRIAVDPAAEHLALVSDEAVASDD